MEIKFVKLKLPSDPTDFTTFDEGLESGAVNHVTVQPPRGRAAELVAGAGMLWRYEQVQWYCDLI